MSIEQQLRRRVCELAEVLKSIPALCSDLTYYDSGRDQLTVALICDKVQRVLAGAANACPHEAAALKGRDLCDRWNRAISDFAAGSEFIDDPERVHERLSQARRMEQGLRDRIREKHEAEVKALQDRLAEARSLLDRAECTDEHLRQMIGQLHFCLVGPWQGHADAVGYLLDKAQKEYAGVTIPRLEEPTPEWVAEFGRRCQAAIPNAVCEDGRWRQDEEETLS